MLINLRNALMAGKRTPTAKDYVQDGLIRHFDGIENGGYGIHRDGKWIDLVTGLEATIGADSIWGSKCLSRTDKTNNAGNMAYLTVDAYNNIAQYFKTIEIVARPTSAGYVYTEQSYRADNKNFRQHGYVWFNGTKVFLGHYSAKSVTIDKTVAQTFCFTQDLVNDAYTTTGSYLNGEASDSGAWNDYYNSNTTVAIGGSNGSSRAILGDVYAIRLYSRALTASEIAANYAIDKARFNLP